MPICLALAVATGMAGCGSASDESISIKPSDTGFVSGDGSVTFIAEPDRGLPIEIAGATLEGQEISLTQRSPATVVNVWASWCAPCRAEADELNAVAAETDSKGVRFVGVNVRDSKPAAAAFQRRFGVEYPSIFDPTSATLLVFGNTLPPNAIPSTIVLDEQNRVAARVLGAVTAPTLRAVIDEVLGLNPAAQQ